MCTILDDASRKVLAAEEFDNATEENSLKVMTEAIEKYRYLYPIRSVISDHGTHSMPINGIKMEKQIMHLKFFLKKEASGRSYAA